MKHVVILAVSIFLLASLEAEEQWKECPKGFQYKSGSLSFSIGNDGAFSNLKDASENLLAKNIHAMGDYIFKGEKHDTRLFQHECKSSPLEISEDGGTCRIRKEGHIGNKVYEKAVRFSEKAEITANRISMECEVEYLVELSSQRTTPFWTMVNIPIETFRNKGYGIKEKSGKLSLSVLPEAYSGKGCIASRLKELTIVLGNRHFIIKSNDEDTFFIISDPRSYDAKGDVFRIDIGKTLPYTNTPRTFSPGTKLKWSFEISFIEIKD